MTFFPTIWYAILLATPACAVVAEPPAAIFDQPVALEGSDGISLHGTLTLPQGIGPHPALVLIGGAAERDRDQIIVGFPTFRVLAEAIARSGFAVLRVDDRGTGETGGSAKSVTQATLTDDALRAVHLLGSRPGIDRNRIGLLGHGEGGITAAEATATSPDVAFLVFMAGICIPIEQLWIDTHVAELTLRGASPRRIDDGKDAMRQLFAAIHANGDITPVEERLFDLAEQDFSKLTQEQRDRFGDANDYFDVSFEGRIVQQAASARFRAHLALDPTRHLARVRVPILALFGAKDLTVRADRNRDALRQATRINPLVTITEIAGANHIFQAAVTGEPQEYDKLDKRFTDDFLTQLTTWLRRRAGIADAK